MMHNRYTNHLSGASAMVRHLGRAIRGARAFFVLRDRTDAAQPQIIAFHPPLSDEALLRCLDAEYMICEPVSEDESHQAFVGLAVPSAYENRELACEMASVAAETLASHATTLAVLDPATGLPDRAAFVARLDERLAAGLASAVLVVDIDRFYRIVARFAEHDAFELLRVVALRLAEHLGSADIASLGGDKFGVLLPRDVDESGALALAALAHEAFRAPLHIAGEDVFVTASIGVVVTETPSAAASILHRADVGIALATDAGGATTRVVRANVNNVPAFDLLRERDVRHAVERQEFTPFFQPIVNTVGGGLHAFEALLRWRNPAEGLLPPSMFLDVLHDTGLIDLVGRRVIRESCEHAARWLALSGTLVPVSVNIAAVQLYAPDFCADISRTLLETGLPAEGLILELTENAFIDDLARARATLAELRTLGVRVLIDDFGSGYSSLTYLHDLPVSGIKLDREWFRCIESSDRQREIVRAIVGLAHFMDMDVVAEGIENAGQHDAARDLACDFAQGFCFARPFDAEHATRYLARTLARRAAA